MTLPAHVLARPLCVRCGVIRLSRANTTGVCDGCVSDPAPFYAPLPVQPPDGLFVCCRCRRMPARHRGGRCVECHRLYQRERSQRRKLEARKMEW